MSATMHIDLRLKSTAQSMTFLAALPVEGPTSKWKNASPVTGPTNTVTLTPQSGVALTFRVDPHDSHHVLVDPVLPRETDPILALLNDCMKDWVEQVTLKP